MVLFLTLTGLCILVAAGLVVLALRLNPKSPVNRAVALNGLLFVVWAIGVGGQFLSVSEDQAWFWYRLATFGSSYNAPSLIWYFLSFSGLSFRAKAITAFPFFFIASVMAISNTLYRVWYSAFVFTSWGPVGQPINPAAWVAFYAVIVFYVWAYVYFSSPSGFGSQRLAWLSRSFRNTVLVSISLYVFSLVLEVVLRLPHFSGFSYAVVAGVWFYQAIRYGLLSPAWSGRSLDLLLALRTPVAYLQSEGTLLRANASFLRIWGADPDSGQAPRQWGELFSGPPPWSETWRRLTSSASEITLDAELPAGRPVKVVLSPDSDQFGDVVGVVLQIAQTDDVAKRLEGFGLTEREAHIAILLGQGLSYQDIADRAFISPGTVRVHCHNILEKLGVNDRAGLVRLLTREE